ncbi:hypothetical protein BGZ76_011599 [Entomortierella beljakovae]|nr:hypothetical protein BGZ76_011599 [Entomortierella beljakovae]
MMFLALRSMPNHSAARQELINAAVALDRKFSAEKGLPRVFTGKTPMNSASACLTNNGDKYFIPFKPEGSKSTHFRLAYAPGDFDTAVREYDRWMEKLAGLDWPLCFGIPKEGALPIHILEQKEQGPSLIDQNQETVINTSIDTTAISEDSNTNSKDGRDICDSTSDLTRTDEAATNDTYLTESRKRTPDIDSNDSRSTRSSKKLKAELDSDNASGLNNNGSSPNHDEDNNAIQEFNVTNKLETLELKSTTSATTSCTSTPEPKQTQSRETTPLSAVPSNAAALVPEKVSRDSTPQTNSQKVDEYRREDLDLTNVPTSLSDVVRVDVSTIPNSGNGLFAKIDLPASTPLGFYFGVPMTENEFDSLKDGLGVASHYSIMYRRTVLDATDENGMPYSDPNGRLYCPFHFMNEDPNGNITFITGSVVNQVICQTNRDVKAGEELFVFYGKEVDRFWEKEGSSSSEPGGDSKKGRAGSRSRAESPIRRDDPTTDRPRRNNIYKPHLPKHVTCLKNSKFPEGTENLTPASLFSFFGQDKNQCSHGTGLKTIEFMMQKDILANNKNQYLRSGPIESFTSGGLKTQDYYFDLPLKHTDPSCNETIVVFARRVIAVDRQNDADKLPWLIFFQGGPGFQGPAYNSGWVKMASKKYNVLLLDQRGTGLSTAITVQSLSQFKTPQEQADYFMQFRADSIVRDSELIRETLLGNGMVNLAALIRDGVSLVKVMVDFALPLTCPCKTVYQHSYRSVIEHTETYYNRFPLDIKRVKKIMKYLATHKVQLPTGGILTPRKFQQLGLNFGVSGGMDRVHSLCLQAFMTINGKEEMSSLFLSEMASQDQIPPIYAVMHESIYCDGPGVASNWTASKLLNGEFKKYFHYTVEEYEAYENDSNRLVYFTGEHMYDWMLDDYSSLQPIKECADILASCTTWPKLYDTDVLARNTVPVAAAMYYNDMYVARECSEKTAKGIQGIRLWVTNEYMHSGLRDNEGVLTKLFKIVSNEIDVPVA